jgi:predicted DsbA family dithiol-disulfide isomerase
MEVEIWSDVMCPFCYIGKRKFETALASFEGKDQVNIIWKSYQLAPDLQTDPNTNNYEYLAQHKGVSLAEAKNMSNYVVDIAAKVGLQYNFDIAVVANSHKAHRFLHFALKHNLQNQAEEALFKAYFTDGQNIDNVATLLKIAEDIGLDPSLSQEVLESDAFASDVQKDIYEAHQVGVRGVPFFVFNRKLAVSGAQEPATFLQALEKASAK